MPVKTKKEVEVDLKMIQRTVSPIVEQAQALKISNKESMEVATELLSRLNKFNDALKVDKEKITKPLNDTLKEVRGRYKPTEEILSEAIEIIRDRMSEYQTQMIQKQREEEAKIAARIGEGKGKLKIETAMKKMDDMKKVDEKVVVQSGAIKFREDKILVITDEGLIPREYLIVDEARLLEDLKAGKTVPGAKVEIKMIPINNR